MRSEQTMTDLILEVAQKDARIKAVLLNGSRANPSVKKDKYQDFDIVYVVDEIDSWIVDHCWIDVFGPRVMLQMPECMRNPENQGNFTYLMLFTDGNRIDLTLVPKANINRLFQDKLTVVLMDKENLFTSVSAPSDSDFHVQPPKLLEYSSCCNNFLWCCQNVAKGIARDQWPYAIGMFDGIVREELTQMLDWTVGVLTDFSVSSGKLGKYYRKYLPEDVYQMFVQTVDTKDPDHLWNAMFTAIACFQKAADLVGSQMEYPYPHQDHQNMKEYLIRFRNSLKTKGSQKSPENIESYLDSEKRIRQWPSKRNQKRKVCEYLSTKFDRKTMYTEAQVNAIISRWHTFNDYFVLRRELVDGGWLKRYRDGSAYWLNEDMFEKEIPSDEIHT